MAYDHIMTRGWAGLLKHAAGPCGEKIRQHYREETGLQAIMNNLIEASNDNLHSSTASVYLFATWVTLKYWGGSTGVPDNFMALARRLWPDEGREADTNRAAGALKLVN